MNRADLFLIEHRAHSLRTDVYSSSSILEVDKKIKNFLKTKKVISARSLVYFLVNSPSDLIENNILSKEERDLFKKNVWKELRNIFNEKELSLIPITRVYEAMNPNPLTKQLCNKCSQMAVWNYEPTATEKKVSDVYYCDDCVSRGCSCNIDPISGLEDKDENGKLYPCSEFIFNREGFDYKKD